MSRSKAKIGIVTFLASQGNAAVAQPHADFAFVPFSVYNDGDGTFSIGSWDISAQVARTGGAKYVAKNGNDTTGDGTSGAPYLTIGKAVTVLGSTADAVIYVGAGRYGWSDGGVQNHAFSVARSIVATGDVTLDAYLSGTAWALTTDQTNTYESTVTAAINLVLDYGTLDAGGDPTAYTAKASIAEVEAAEGSYYYDGGTPKKIYVHALGHGSPDADVRPQYSGQALRTAVSGTKMYLEGIKFYNCCINMANNGAPNTGKLYAKDCRFMYFKDVSSYPGMVRLRGYDAILQGCQFGKSHSVNIDGLYGEAYNTVISRVITIDCSGHTLGTTGATNVNVNTNHGAGLNVDLNGEYYDTYGPPVAFINNGKAWLLGTNSHDCAIGSGTSDVNYLNNGTAWLDECISSGSTYDISVDSGNTIYTRSCTLSAGQNTGAGTVTTY